MCLRSHEVNCLVLHSATIYCKLTAVLLIHTVTLWEGRSGYSVEYGHGVIWSCSPAGGTGIVYNTGPLTVLLTFFSVRGPSNIHVYRLVAE